MFRSIGRLFLFGLFVCKHLSLEKSYSELWYAIKVIGLEIDSVCDVTDSTTTIQNLSKIK